MYEKTVNRVDFDLSWWKDKEKNIDNIFQDISPNVKTSRAYRKARMENFQSVYKRYRQQRHTLNKDEKLSLKLLGAAIKAQRKQLYPNWWIRNTVRLVKGVIELIKGIIDLVTSTPGQWKNDIGHFDTVERTKSQNHLDLHKSLRDNGFEQAIPELDQQLKKGLAEFNISLPFYLDKEKSIEYQLHFRREADGTYEFDRYAAHLQHENDKDQNRSRTFRMVEGKGFNAAESRNLLEGRAVEKTVVDFEGNSTNTWVQLNFSERDSDHQFKLKRFPPEHGFTLDKLLDGMPFRELSNPVDKQALFTKLSNGEIAPVTYDDGFNSIPMYAYADPKSGEIKYMTENSLPVTQEQIQTMQQNPGQAASLIIEQPEQAQQQQPKLNNNQPRIRKAPAPKTNQGPKLN